MVAVRQPTEAQRLRLLALATGEMTRAEDEQEVYDLLAPAIRAVCGEAMVIAGAVAPESESVSVRSVAGLGRTEQDLWAVLGSRLEGLTIPRVRDDVARALATERLKPLSDELVELLLQHLPEPLSRYLSEQAQLRQVLVVGLYRKGRLHGFVGLLIRHGGLAGVDIVEVLVNQAAVILSRLAAERSLAASQKEYRTLVESLGEGVLLLDGEQRVLLANPAAARMVGRDHAKELSGLEASSLFLSSAAAEQLFSTARTSPQGTWDEMELRRTDQKTLLVGVTATPERTSRQKREHLTLVLSDLSDLRAREAVLRFERESLEEAARSIKAGLVVVTARYRVIWVSELLWRTFRIRPGQTCFRALAGAAHSCFGCPMAAALAGEEPARTAFRLSLCSRDDTRLAATAWTQALRNSVGEVIGSVHVVVPGHEPDKAGGNDKAPEVLHKLFSRVDRLDRIGEHFLRFLQDRQERESGAPGPVEPWLALDEVAEYLGLKRDTVYKWIARKGLPGHKVGWLWRFRRSEIDRWLREQERPKHPD